MERESSAHRRIRSRLVAGALERGGEGAALGRIGGVGGDSAGEVHAGGAERAGRGEGCVAEAAEVAGIGGAECQDASSRGQRPVCMMMEAARRSAATCEGASRSTIRSSRSASAGSLLCSSMAGCSLISALKSLIVARGTS